VRHQDDAAWPGPVWGKHPATPYAADQIDAIRQRIGALLEESELFEPA